MSACSKYRCKRYPFGLGTLKPKFWLPNLSYDSRASPPNETNIPSANGRYLTMSHGSAWRVGFLQDLPIFLVVRKGNPGGGGGGGGLGGAGGAPREGGGER